MDLVHKQAFLVAPETSNMGGDMIDAEDVAQQDTTTNDDDQEIRFVDWDPSGRFGRVSRLAPPSLIRALSPQKYAYICLLLFSCWVLSRKSTSHWIRRVAHSLLTHAPH